MNLFLISISDWTPSRKGGRFKTCLFKNLDDRKDRSTYTLYVYENHSESKRFLPYLVLGTIFQNMEIFKGKKLSGYSKFIVNGNIHRKKEEV